MRQKSEESGSFYHVIMRAKESDRIFDAESERVRFCRLLQKWKEQHGHQIHAFCLMDTHIHLLVQRGDHPIARIFASSAPRFRALLVYNKRHLLELLRYVHL